VKGERIRETFPTKGEAESRAAQIRVQVENEGQAAFSLPASIRTEAVRAVEKLTPHNATISEAVDHYLQHVLKYRAAPVITEIIEKLLADAAANHRRERTIKDLRHRLTMFAKTYGGSRIAEITREELKDWLQDPTLGARSRINYAVKLSQLWNYAIANGWAENNLVASIPRPDAEDSDPEIFTVEQAAGLLEHAEEYDLLGYIVLGVFAGLRSAEINRLDWKDVKLAERNIIIGTAVAKKRSRRVVEINDTLAAWLPLCAKTKGPVVPLDSNRTLYARLAKLATAAGLEKWPDNGLRHSCASYSLALTGDAVRVAYQLGNSADMIHRHYKALVTKADSKRFWELRPAADAAGKIVPIVANG
jgi:integrase